MGGDSQTFASGAPIMTPAAAKSLTHALKKCLRDWGADLVGVGLIDRFQGVPENFDPRRYLPDAKALISIALHVNEAACDLIARCRCGA